MSVANPWLAAAGMGMTLAALMHLACVVVGAPLYRRMGAGERIAAAVERGKLAPQVLTVGITVILSAMAAYAFAGAGLLGPLPLLRAGLLATTVILLARGLVIIAPGALRRPDLSQTFITTSSAIVLALGALYAIGLAYGWNSLGAL